MNIDDIIHDFAFAGHDLPRVSMQWALDNWDVAFPRFHEMLERYADGSDRDEETANALFFIIHLIGDKHEGAAFPALCRLLKDPEASEAILDEAITDGLNRILISAYNGDAGVLQDLIESPGADEYVRAAALEAMAYLAASGAVSEEIMRSYLLRLLDDLQPQDESFVWSAWAISIANLGYADFSGRVEDLCRREFIARLSMNFKNFNEQLRLTLDDPERKAGFARDRIAPFEDAIGTLSSWYGFSKEAKMDAARRLAAETAEQPSWLSLATPHVNIHRGIGRNDPCPCGSGKKFKKCCLV
jgi:hypothetical protein